MISNYWIRRAIIIFSILVSVSDLSAMGRADEAELQDVTGLENWDHRMDSTDLPAGEYNIIIRGTDTAGNIGTGGPYNVFIDPSIQIPVISISNPIEGSRFGNIVHVVGTAADDEAVERVEIAVDDGNYQPAVGGAFWSARLDSSGWDDGLHHLKARAWDKEGNESTAAEVSFFKDTGKPEIEILSHPMGSYISGKIILKGIITDLNAVSEAFFSDDSGLSFSSLKISKSNVDGQWEFSRKIDTLSVEDGAHVYWIEAVDGLGSKSRQSFLFYIDNSPPNLELLYPGVEDSVNGQINLVGRALDAVGISNLRYQADNGAEGDISLSPGNPVWVLPLDYSGIKRKEAKVKIFLMDIVGNQISETYKIPLDQEGDLPLPGISENTPVVFSGIPVITGMIIDDDGPSGVIEYSLNKGKWQSLETKGPWVLPLEESVSGINTIELRAVDKYGLTGSSIIKSFNRAPEAPVIVIDDYFPAETAIPWMPGSILDAANPGVITGRVLNPGTLKLFLSVNGGEAKPLALKAGSKDDEKSFFIKLPKNTPSGRINMRISGIDDSGKEYSTETEYYNYLKPETEEGVEVPQYNVPDTKGVYLILPQMRAVEDSYIMLSEDLYISGWVVGGDIESVVFSGGNDFLKTEYSANGFRIVAVGEGKVDDLVLTILLENGDELKSEPMNIAFDRSSPVIEISNLTPGMLSGEELDFSISATDNTGISKLYYSTDGGNFFKNLISEEGVPVSISLSEMNNGFVDLVIKAEDSFGNNSIKYLPVLKDTIAPEVSFITSSFDSGAEQITWSGKVLDNDMIETIEFDFIPPSVFTGEEAGVMEGQIQESFQLKNFSAKLNGDVFYLDVNLTELGFDPGSVVLTTVDRGGNRKEIDLNLNVNLDEGRPLVGIQVPEEMGSSETGFNLSGLILDREGVESILYSVNDGPFREGGTGNLFSIPLNLSELLDDHNKVSVKAIDVNGLESETISRNFLISLEEPEVRLDYPELNTIVRGTVVLKGVSSDVNGIRRVSLSHDNGNTFQEADGQEEWSYNLDTRLLKNGISSLLIKAEDGAGVYGYYTTLINVDNEAPKLSLSHPADGEKIRNSLALSGRAVDNDNISSLKVIMTRLASGSATEINVPVEENLVKDDMVWEIHSRGTVLEDIDLRGFNPGFYSFRAEALDGAENLSTVSRVIELLPDSLRPPEIYSPLPGDTLGPYFSIQGYLPDYSPKVLLMVNDEIFKAVDVRENGSFRYDVTPEDNFPSGGSRLSVRIETAEESLESEGIFLEYKREGLWVSFDNLSSGQYVTDRFVIEGSTAYETTLDDEKEIKKLNPDSLRLSLDGGMSFEKVRIKDGRWEYTLYSEEVPDGAVDLLVQSSNESEVAYARCRIEMDSKGPEISLLSPDENERLYGSLFFYGEASDDSGLSGVTLSFREGGKDSYETPSFIQGMYFDASVFGATYFTAGLGLTFMDDNVKLQVQYGFAPRTMVDPETNLERAARFGGNVFGAKLLANLAQIPFSWLFGPEFSAFSATAALGADFSYFSSNSVTDEDSWGVILAGVIGQVELPKVTFEDRNFIKYVSVFWEGQLWLISSDVSPEVTLLPSIGVRLGLF